MQHIEDAMAHYWPFVGGIHCYNGAVLYTSYSHVYFTSLSPRYCCNNVASKFARATGFYEASQMRLISEGIGASYLQIELIMAMQISFPV